MPAYSCSPSVSVLTREGCDTYRVQSNHGGKRERERERERERMRGREEGEENYVGGGNPPCID
eukprot:1160663-Pelagomonas_calceolata.AAC.1